MSVSGKRDERQDVLSTGSRINPFQAASFRRERRALHGYELVMRRSGLELTDSQRKRSCKVAIIRMNFGRSSLTQYVPRTRAVSSTSSLSHRPCKYSVLTRLKQSDRCSNLSSATLRVRDGQCVSDGNVPLYCSTYNRPIAAAPFSASGGSI